MRHVLLHHHIFKNAGTTLDFALERALGEEFSTIHAEIETGVVNKNKLLDFLNRNPKIKAVSSHHFHAQEYDLYLREHHYRIFNLALVRRSIIRLLSIYKQYRRSVGAAPLYLAAERSLSDFMNLLIARYPHFVDNPQVNIFANYGFYCRAVSYDDLMKAQARFSSFALCAPVERLEEAMVVLEYTLTPICEPHQPNLAYLPQNVSQQLPDEENLRNLIGTENFDWLQRVNAHDEALREAADKELNRKIEVVPNFEQRLHDFRRRCAEIDGSSGAMGKS